MTGPGARAVGVLLAGGQSSRMGGGDKCLRRLGGESILSRVVARARPQVAALVINANGDPQRFAGFGLPVAADVIGGFQGPLAGILTGLEWAAAHRPEVDYVVSFATDAPFVPTDLVSSLIAAAEDAGAELACALSGGRTHPVFGLWPLSLRTDLRRAMEDEEMRKIDRWTARYALVHVDFPCDPVDPFFNVNRPENLAEAERLLGPQAAEGAA